jgi:hypothetical protein
MPSFDDERFERYLKGFRPVAASRLAIKGSWWRSRRATVMATLAVAATILAVAAVMLRSRRELIEAQRAGGSAAVEQVEQLANAQPLTIHSANAMLAQAPSAKAAIDSLAFQSQKTSIPQGQRSALAELGKERNKL